MFNIVQPQNSHALEVRLQHLEESLYNLLPAKILSKKLLQGRLMLLSQNQSGQREMRQGKP